MVYGPNMVEPGEISLKAELLEFFIGRLADPESHVFGSPPWFTGLERTRNNFV